MHEILIADAGPLIALARIERLYMLPRLFRRTLTTDIVWAECLANPTEQERTQLLLAHEHDWLGVVMTPIPSNPWRLGAGEVSALTLALERGSAVLIDDRAARRTAIKLGLAVIGVVGVLTLAKRKGLIDVIHPDLDHLASTGYHLAPALLIQALRQVNESP